MRLYPVRRVSRGASARTFPALRAGRCPRLLWRSVRPSGARDRLRARAIAASEPGAEGGLPEVRRNGKINGRGCAGRRQKGKRLRKGRCRAGRSLAGWHCFCGAGVFWASLILFLSFFFFFPELRLLPGVGGRSPARRGAWGERGSPLHPLHPRTPLFAGTRKLSQ